MVRDMNLLWTPSHSFKDYYDAKPCLMSVVSSIGKFW